MVGRAQDHGGSEGVVAVKGDGVVLSVHSVASAGAGLARGLVVGHAGRARVVVHRVEAHPALVVPGGAVDAIVVARARDRVRQVARVVLPGALEAGRHRGTDVARVVGVHEADASALPAEGCVRRALHVEQRYGVRAVYARAHRQPVAARAHLPDATATNVCVSCGKLPR